MLSNGGGFYHPFAYIAEAMRAGIRILPPDINASPFRCVGKDDWIRVGLQFIKGLSAAGVERVTGGQADRRTGGLNDSFFSLEDLRRRTGLSHDDLRILIKVGVFDSIAQGKTRPMMLWEIDASEASRVKVAGSNLELASSLTACPPDRLTASIDSLPTLKEYSQDRRRREQYESLGFLTDLHPMALHTDDLARLRLVKSTELSHHVGRSVLMAGMLTTSKPVHTVKEEPMEFATFDDGHGLVEAVLFPDIYRDRGHVLFDQGPFVFRGKVEEEFGGITVTMTHLDRLDRFLAKARARS